MQSLWVTALGMSCTPHRVVRGGAADLRFGGSLAPLVVGHE
jgi:hypothetical protein